MFEEELENLEKKYREKTFFEKPFFEEITCFHEKGIYQKQFFVLDKAEEKTDTIVILIGVNYTQKQKAEESIYPQKEQIIEQGINSGFSFSNSRAKLKSQSAKQQKLNLLRKPFDVLYTNLSPWITNSPWRMLSDKKDRKYFLNEAARMGYIADLLPLLQKHFKNIIWIGHTLDIEDELWEFFKRNEFKDIDWFLAQNIACYNTNPEKWKIKKYIQPI